LHGTLLFGCFVLYRKAGIHWIVIFKPLAVNEACGTLCRVIGGVGGICISVSSLSGFFAPLFVVGCLFLSLPHWSSTAVQFDSIVDLVFSQFHVYKYKGPSH
jgi:hypothetical protein